MGLWVKGKGRDHPVMVQPVRLSQPDSEEARKRDGQYVDKVKEPEGRM